ncbi:MAG: metallophosphoesterase family protein [Chlamydiae bacterium]|nr:metallophosphoesterase family protein [Chlamydiota bacterium]
MRLACLVWVCQALFSSLYALEAFYLTYPNSPTNSIAVHWFDNAKERGASQLLYRQEGESNWKQALAEEVPFEEYRLKKVVLQDLTANTTYDFQIEEKIYSFQTLSEEGPWKIVFGGDSYRKPALFTLMCRQVLAKEPQCVVLGGDIAYANRGKATSRWVAFFKAWQESMITKTGKVVPLVGVVGNHDVEKKGRNQWFYSLFPYLEKQSYGVLEIGKNIALFLLDTGHLAPIQGDQSDWLAKSLHERQKTPLKIASYHVAAYPSVYAYDKKASSLIRSLWVPFFETYGVKLVFEHHNHGFKRTHPLLSGKIDFKGITYLGDGAFGAPARSRGGDRWYLEQRLPSLCASIVEIDKNICNIITINEKGSVIDTFSFPW